MHALISYPRSSTWFMVILIFYETFKIRCSVLGSSFCCPGTIIYIFFFLSVVHKCRFRVVISDRRAIYNQQLTHKHITRTRDTLMDMTIFRWHRTTALTFVCARTLTFSMHLFSLTCSLVHVVLVAVYYFVHYIPRCCSLDLIMGLLLVIWLFLLSFVSSIHLPYSSFASWSCVFVHFCSEHFRFRFVLSLFLSPSLVLHVFLPELCALIASTRIQKANIEYIENMKKKKLREEKKRATRFSYFMLLWVCEPYHKSCGRGYQYKCKQQQVHSLKIVVVDSEGIVRLCNKTDWGSQHS